MADWLSWVKKTLEPAAQAHSSRSVTAVAMATAAVSVMRFVEPIDTPSIALRYTGLAVGIVGFIWLIVLLLFPPHGPTGHNPRKPPSEGR